MALSYDELKNKVLTRYGDIDSIPDSVYNAMKQYQQKGNAALDDDRTYNILVAERDYSGKQSAEPLRQLAKEQYAQDVASQKAEAIDAYKRENPITSALFPRSSIDAATGDRGVVGSLYDAFADVSSAPGRAVARLVSGDNEIPEEARAEHPYLSKAYDVAKNIATDPLLIPSIAVGGPIAQGVAKTGLTGAKLLLAGAGIGAGTNVALGAVGRGGSQDQTVKAFDPKAMALDAAVGAGLPIAGAGLMKLGSLLKESGAQGLGREALEALTPEEAQRLVGALVQEGKLSPRAMRVGAELSEGTKAQVEKEAGRILTTNPLENPNAPSLLGSNRAKIAENLQTHGKVANQNVQDMLQDLDQNFISTQMKNDAITRSYEPVGVDRSGKMLYQDPRNPMEFAFEHDLAEHGLNPSDYVDIAFDQFRNRSGIKHVSDVTERAAKLKADLEMLESTGGYVSPSNAFKWAQDLAEEAKSIKASKTGKTQVAEFLNDVANNVNRKLADLGSNAGKASGKTTPIYQNAEGEFLRGSEYIPEIHAGEFQQVGEVPDILFPYKQTVGRKETLGQIAQGAARSGKYSGSALDEIEPWKFAVAPLTTSAQVVKGGIRSPLAKLRTGEVIESSGRSTLGDLVGDTPITLPRKAPRSFTNGEETGFDHLVDAGIPSTSRAPVSGLAQGLAKVAASVRNAPLASGTARAAYQHLQNRRDLTEMEYRNIISIIGIPASQRTAEQKAYLSQYGY